MKSPMGSDFFGLARKQEVAGKSKTPMLRLHSAMMLTLDCSQGLLLQNSGHVLAALHKTVIIILEFTHHFKMKIICWLYLHAFAL